MCVCAHARVCLSSVSVTGREVGGGNRSSLLKDTSIKIFSVITVKEKALCFIPHRMTSPLWFIQEHRCHFCNVLGIWMSSQGHVVSSCGIGKEFAGIPSPLVSLPRWTVMPAGTQLALLSKAHDWESFSFWNSVEKTGFAVTFQDLMCPSG